MLPLPSQLGESAICSPGEVVRVCVRMQADIADAQEILEGTAWDGPIATVRLALAQLRAALRLQPAANSF